MVVMDVILMDEIAIEYERIDKQGLWTILAFVVQPVYLEHQIFRHT